LSQQKQERIDQKNQQSLVEEVATLGSSSGWS